jgi:two-component system, sensor histidine kinase
MPHRAALAVPMVIDGAVVGVFGVGPPAGRTFAAPEIHVVGSLAGYAAIALRNASLFAAEQAARGESERARREAEAANRAKDEFLAMLGHELRNPLAAITAASAVLDRPSADRAMAARARMVIGRQSGHLARLVDDLLDVGRVTIGKIVLDRHPTDLGELVRSAVEAFREAGRAEGRRLNADTASVWVVGDETRLEQVITNLLGNAAKFTQNGGTIEVIATADGPDAIVRVIDDGVGISAAILPRIFDLFVQGESTLAAHAAASVSA